MTHAFLNLLLDRMQSSKTTGKEFVQLAKVYGGVVGGKEKKPKVKPAKATSSAPAVPLTETEQIMEIEAAQRKSNG